MSIRFAVDELYEAGWRADGVAGVERAPDGRAYPTVGSVEAVFSEAGCPVQIQGDGGLGVFVASWGDEAVVGGSRDEAAVYALARFVSRGGVGVG